MTTGEIAGSSALAGPADTRPAAWAPITAIVPKASAGRYAGFGNIVEATNGPIATSIGRAMIYAVALRLEVAIGSAVAMLTAVVMFARGAALLARIRESRRSRGESRAAELATAA